MFYFNKTFINVVAIQSLYFVQTKVFPPSPSPFQGKVNKLRLFTGENFDGASNI